MELEFLPSVVAQRSARLAALAKIAQRLSHHWHLDIADQTFVPHRTVGPSLVQRLRGAQPAEIHLMTRQPANWLEVILALNIRTVLVHVELGRALKPLIAVWRSQRRRIGLAINADTPLGALRPWVSVIPRVHVMSVHPGQYGGRFLPASIERIRRIHRRWPRLSISVDGGMNATTIPLAVKAGANRVIIGSDVMRNVDPGGEWARLQALRRQLRNVIS